MAAIVPWSVAGKAMGTVGKPLPEIQMKRKSTPIAVRNAGYLATLRPYSLMLHSHRRKRHGRDKLRQG